MRDAVDKCNVSPPHSQKRYDLRGGARNTQEFITRMNKQIKQQAPEVNISEVVDQYYNRDEFKGKIPIANKLIFRNALHRENVKTFDLEDDPKERETPLFHLTRDVEKSPKKKSVKE